MKLFNINSIEGRTKKALEIHQQKSNAAQEIDSILTDSEKKEIEKLRKAHDDIANEVLKRRGEYQNKYLEIENDHRYKDEYKNELLKELRDEHKESFKQLAQEQKEIHNKIIDVQSSAIDNKLSEANNLGLEKLSVEELNYIGLMLEQNNDMDNRMKIATRFDFNTAVLDILNADKKNVYEKISHPLTLIKQNINKNIRHSDEVIYGVNTPHTGMRFEEVFNGKVHGDISDTKDNDVIL